MDDLISRKAVRDGMMKYGFHAPDMTVHEFVEDELPSVPDVPLDDLISREAAIEALGEEPLRWNNTITEGQEWNDWKYHVNAIKSVPSITAVPLEPLCEWLARQFECPCNFSPIDEEMFEHCKGDCVNDDIECWKRVLKQFMEGQHET